MGKIKDRLKEFKLGVLDILGIYKDFRKTHDKHPILKHSYIPKNEKEKVTI